MNSQCCCQTKCKRENQGESQNKIQPIPQDSNAHVIDNNINIDTQDNTANNRNAIIKHKKKGDQTVDDNSYKNKSIQSSHSSDNPQISTSKGTNKNPVIDDSLLRPIAEDNDELNFSQCENKNILPTDLKQSNFSQISQDKEQAKNNTSKLIKAQNNLNNSKVSSIKKSKQKSSISNPKQVKDGIEPGEDLPGQGTKYINNISNINLTFNNMQNPTNTSEKKGVKTLTKKKSKRGRSFKLDSTNAEEQSNSSSGNILNESSSIIDSKTIKNNSSTSNNLNTQFPANKESTIKNTEFSDNHKDNSMINANREILDDLKDNNLNTNAIKRNKTTVHDESKINKQKEFLRSNTLHKQVINALTWMTQIEKFYGDDDEEVPQHESKETENHKFGIDSVSHIDNMNITNSNNFNTANKDETMSTHGQDLNEEIIDITSHTKKSKVSVGKDVNISIKNNNLIMNKKISQTSDSDHHIEEPAYNLTNFFPKKIPEPHTPVNISIIKEQLDQDLMQKLGFDQTPPSSDSEEEERKITRLSQRAIFGYYFSHVEQDICEKEKSLRPRLRRSSSKDFNYPVFYEYLQETIDKREYIHGVVLNQAIDDPGWLSYIDLYKIALKKLELQNWLIGLQKDSLKTKEEYEEADIMKSDVLKKEEIMSPTIKNANSRTLNVPIAFDENPSSKKKRKGPSKNDLILQANIAANSRIKKLNKLRAEAEREVNFGKEFIVQFKKFHLYKKISYDEALDQMQELNKKYFIDDKINHRRYQNFDDWVIFKIEQHPDFDLKQFEQNMLEMQMMGEFILNLALTLGNSTRQTMNFLLCKKEQDVFRNLMSGYYQKYCLVQRYLDLYLIDHDKELKDDSLVFCNDGQKFINSKLYNKNIDDIKIEAICDVVFAQKTCEIYYKDYKKGKVNFFGVLKCIGKYKEDRRKSFNVRVNFYEERTKEQVKLHRNEFSYETFVVNFREVKNLRIAIINDIYEKQIFDAEKYDLYKSFYFIIRDNLSFLIFEDQRTKKYGQTKDMCIAEVSFGEEFNKVIIDYQENYIKSVQDLKFRIEGIATEINFWSEFDEIYKEDDMEKIAKNEIAESQLKGFTTKKVGDILLRYLTNQLDKQKTVLDKSQNGVNDKNKELEQVRYKLFNRVSSLKHFEEDEKPKVQEKKAVIRNFGKNAKSMNAKELTAPKRILVESNVFEHNKVLDKIDEKNELDYEKNELDYEDENTKREQVNKKNVEKEADTDVENETTWKGVEK